MWFFPSFDPSCYSYWFAVATVVSRSPTNREGLPGVLWKKGTLAKYRREQRNSSLFLENRGTKIYKLENGNIVSKLGEQMRETCGNMGTWEQRPILERGQRNKDPSGRPAIVLLMWHTRHFSSLSTELQPAKNRPSLNILWRCM